MKENPVIVIAIGGNAITKENQKGTLEEKLENIENCVDSIADLLEMGYQIVLTHGNGPQVGNILLQVEAASQTVPSMPLDVCGAASQGQLGYLLQRTLNNKIKARGIKKEVVTILTQIVVDPADQAFLNPTKPIGPFYTQQDANRIMEEKNQIFKEDSGRGYRRVVPSPKPVKIVERDIIKMLVEEGKLVIAAGGGGIPVIMSEGGYLQGIEAVIDKDWASAILAGEINADLLIILTGVDQVAINFGKPDVKWIPSMAVSEAKGYRDEGHFPAGSMGPKMDAAIDFVEKTGGRALITSLDKVGAALKRETGTFIAPDNSFIEYAKRDIS